MFRRKKVEDQASSSEIDESDEYDSDQAIQEVYM